MIFFSPFYHGLIQENSHLSSGVRRKRKKEEASMQLVIELLLSNNNQRVRWRHERRYVLKHKPDNLQKLFARCQTVLSISPQHHTWQLVGDKERGVVKAGVEVTEEEERSTRFKPEWCKDGDSE